MEENKHPDFKMAELACKDVSKTPVPSKYLEPATILLNNLQVLRNELKVPIFINSGYRTSEHNKFIGGAANSFHLRAMAADIRSDVYSPKKLKETIEKLISEDKMREGGVGLYKTFVHYDIRGYKVRF